MPTVDLSGLRFADSAAVRTLIDAHLALKKQGGTLELARPAAARGQVTGADWASTRSSRYGRRSDPSQLTAHYEMRTALRQRVNECGRGNGIACLGPDAARAS